MANTENLTPFQKGHKSKGGRPKGAVSITTTLKNLIEKELDATDPFTKKACKKTGRELIALQLMAKAMKGDIKAIREVMDRLEGKPQQTITADVTTQSHEQRLEILTACANYTPDADT